MIINGTDLLLYYSTDDGATWTALAHATSHSLSYQMKTRDVSHKRSGTGRVTQRSRTGMTGSAAGLVSYDADCDYHVFQGFIKNRTLLKIASAEDNGSDAPDTTNIVTSDIYLTDVSKDVPDDENVTYSITFEAAEDIAHTRGGGGVTGITAQEYAELNYGALVCWGMESFENVEYTVGNLPEDTFAPTDLDIDQWFASFVATGMKYAMLVVKHHNGFALYPTQWAEDGYDPFSIAQTTWYANNGSPDIYDQFMTACRANDILPCVYYSIWDKTHEIRSGTDETTDPTSYMTMIKFQLNELLTQYGYVYAVWFDGWGWHVSFDDIDYDEIYNYIQQISPGTLVVNNSQEHPTVHSDVEVFEFTPPQKGNTFPSEEVKGFYSMSIDDGTHFISKWFYASDVDNTVDGYRTARYLKNQIALANRNNAAYLLGIPVDTTGHLPAAQETILAAINTLAETNVFYIHLIKNGTGAGVAIMKLESSENLSMEITNAGRFYDDAAGTVNEGTTRTITAGSLLTFYVKCASGTADIIISDADKLLHFGKNTSGTRGWDGSAANAPYCYFDTYFVPATLQSLNVYTGNDINGDVSDLPDLTNLVAYGANTLYGDFADLPKNATSMQIIGTNKISGDIGDLDRSNVLIYFIMESNYGSVSYTSRTWTSSIRRITFNPSVTAIKSLTSTEVDNLLIDLAEATWDGTSRVLDLRGSNAARTSASDDAVTALGLKSVSVYTNV